MVALERSRMARTASSADTAQRILDVAERLVQTRGYNGFSYADIAAVLKLTKASLHYHYPSKAELGERLIERYEHAFLDALAAIDADTGDARERLRRYAAIYESVLRANRMCLCGMLASDYSTLPKPMKDRLRHYFDANERWLVAVLEAGRAAGTLRFTGGAEALARTIVGSLEGAMMLARSYGDPERFCVAADRLLAEL
jgi:TetR/AcrR family transcriptional regulator, transcriptional repressor for nem operon